jgi:ABC-type phosphate transport system substrate-binding protein
MKPFFTSLLALCCLAPAHALAGDVKIIANASVSATEISADELKSIFLANKTSLASAGHVEPVLEKGGATHEEFLKTYLGKSDSALTAYYRSLVFTGKGSMPKAFASDGDVAAYVAKTKGAIGYIAAASDPGEAKTLTVK